MFSVLSSVDSRFASLSSGNLSAWARQGVLLLNAVLTVQLHKPNSHAGKHVGKLICVDIMLAGIGWEQFTDAVVKYVSERCQVRV